MKKIFVNGSFDIIHFGHIDLLNAAKALGDHLMVAIDSDRRISEKKGPDRPFNSQFERYSLMSSLKPVDSVRVFDSDEELIDIIREYKPDVMMVGSDWQGKRVIGCEHSKELVYFDRTYDESTTNKIERYIDRRQMCR